MPLTAEASLAIDSMLAKNMISPVIDQDKYIGTTLVSKTRTNYKLFNAKLVAPANLQLQLGNAAIETRLQYNNYDALGNIITVNKTGDLKNAYIWDYQKSFVIAQVLNSDSASMAFTSFESDGTGNWVFTDTARNRSFAMTGSQSYNITTGKTITKSVTSGKAYVVSYWSRNGAVTVMANSVSVAVSLTGLLKNGWTYYEHILPSTTTTISISATNAIIDELRLYPQGALMTTYTYSPLVGTTSVCSPSNTIVYYEYDNFNRLKVIRDMDKNIVKVIDYEYQVSAHTFYSAAKSGTFTKVCTSCQIGNAVVFNVIANKYTSVISQADADQKAQSDVDNNGQANANTFGTCSAPGNAPLTGSNNTTANFSISFHNTCTGTNYNFTLNITTGTPLSPIPVGNYNMTINPVGRVGTFTYRLNGFVQHTGTATFSNIDLTSSSNTLVVTN